MSAQAIPAKPGNQFVNTLPDDAIGVVFGYLKDENGALSVRGETDDRAIIATSKVCRSWRNDAALTTERQEAATRLHQRAHLQGAHREMRLLNEYPPEMVRVFRNNHTPISQLPVLDLGDRRGSTDYIDFIQPGEMSHSVMKFRDILQRPGIALKIRARASAHETVLAIFKRHASPESRQWSLGWGDSDTTIQNLYVKRHDANDHVGGIRACQNCPFVNAHVNEAILSSLLNGQDPDFSLSGHNDAQPGNQVAMRGRRGLSERTILVTAIAAIASAYFVNYYPASERG